MLFPEIMLTWYKTANSSLIVMWLHAVNQNNQKKTELLLKKQNFIVSMDISNNADEAFKK